MNRTQAIEYMNWCILALAKGDDDKAKRYFRWATKEMN